MVFDGLNYAFDPVQKVVRALKGGSIIQPHRC
jgi:hypothetical protein